MTRHTLTAILVGSMIASLSACSEKTPSISPPQIRAGRDACAECGMIINQDKFASALIVERDSVRETLLFDDIGDMLEHQRSHPDLVTLAAYVHDHDTHAWISANSAVYLSGSNVRTPMGSCIIAFTTAAAADAAQPAVGGVRMTIAELRASVAPAPQTPTNPQ